MKYMEISPAESREHQKEHWKQYTVGVMSASSALNHAAIDNTYSIGKMLAKNGYDGRNGGYSAGAMKSFADGFREEARTLGASDKEITEHFHGVIFSDKAIGEGLKNQRGVNATSSIEEAHTLSDRAGGIINNSDAIIVVEGGIGTELEGLLAAQGEWFAQKKNAQLQKEVVEARDAERLTPQVESEKRRQMVPIKPIISIDSKQMFADIIELCENRSPKTIDTLTEHMYVLTGHTAPTSEEVATIKNDPKAAKKLEMLLRYYYLLNKQELSSQETEEQSSLRRDLFDAESPFRVWTMKERLAAKNQFEAGAGI